MLYFKKENFRYFLRIFEVTNLIYLIITVYLAVVWPGFIWQDSFKLHKFEFDFYSYLIRHLIAEPYNFPAIFALIKFLCCFEI